MGREPSSPPGGDPTSASWAGRVVWSPPTDVLLTEDEVVVRLELAGLSMAEVRVRAEARAVVVSGVRRDPMGPSPRRVDRMEIVFGPFEQSIPLPAEVVADRAEVRLVDGLLVITLPLSPP